MSWVEANMVQFLYWMNIARQLLPLVLTVAIIFTFFLVRSFARKLSRMEFYLDRIDNHLSEVTYLIKEYRTEKCGKDDTDQGAGAREQQRAVNSGAQGSAVPGMEDRDRQPTGK